MSTASNFAFLVRIWPDLARLGASAEALLYLDSQACLARLRTFEEALLVSVLVKKNRAFEIRNVFDGIAQIDRCRRVYPEIRQVFHSLRILGNRAVHKDLGTQEDATKGRHLAHQLAAWAAKKYIRDLDVSPFVVPNEAIARRDLVIPCTSDGIGPIKAGSGSTPRRRQKG